MRRRLARLVTILPLIGLVLVLLAWARSYLPDETFLRASNGKVILFFASGHVRPMLDQSGLRFGDTPRFNSTGEAVTYFQQVASSSGLPQWEQHGFAVVGFTWGKDVPCYFAVPFWFLVLVLALLSLWARVTHRQRLARSEPGRCRRCGYDLRGSTDTCPECGTPFNPSPARPQRPDRAELPEQVGV